MSLSALALAAVSAPAVWAQTAPPALGDAAKAELDSIVEETQKEEEQLRKISEKARTIVDERLLAGYNRLRNNTRSGLAVVSIQRDACGGCFNKIPPQRQLDIRQHKKVIVCEHCGRILVDPRISGDDVVAE